MEPKHRYALAALLTGLVVFGFAAAYRAGQLSAESRPAPIVISAGSMPAPPAATSAPQAAAAPQAAPLPPAPEVPVAEAPAAENPAPTRTRVGHARHSAKLRDPSEGLVNVNTAGVDELTRLPGVGPKMASKIVDYRTQIGPFRSPEDLRNVSGIGEKKLDKMRPFLQF